MAEIPHFLHQWVGPNLPKEHIFVDPEDLPSDPYLVSRLYFRKWLVHPLKRHVTHWYSRHLSYNGCDIIGITGTAGKTTTKEMAASVLEQKYSTIRSRENIDPVYNIPTTVLSATSNTKKLVLEMAIEYPGEMDFYLWLAQPKIGIVTTIYLAHTQNFGDLANVIYQKGRLIESLPKNGYAILNSDDSYTKELADRSRAEVVWYGLQHSTDFVQARIAGISNNLKTKFDLKIGNQETRVELPVLGYHFVPLALAAASVGFLGGVSIEDIKFGLENFTPQPHRMIPIILTDGTLIIDDTYNANPLATRAAIKLLGSIYKERRKLFVFGEMKSLGRYNEIGHREVGACLAENNIDIVLTLGVTHISQPKKLYCEVWITIMFLCLILNQS